MTTVLSMIPEDRVYEFDANSNRATISIETQRRGEPVRWAHVTAQLSVAVDRYGEPALVAEFVDNDGVANDDQIAYALRCIETNSFAS